MGRLIVRGGSVTAQADWIARSTASGVIWAHDFQSAAEVDNFRITGAYAPNSWGGGNDPTNLQNPSDCIYNPNDGITGGCLQFTTPDGGDVESHGSWNRPFSPLLSPGNGLAFNDAALGGTLTRQTWNSSLAYMCGTWGKGYYVNTAYDTTAGDRGWTSAGTPGPNGFASDNIAGHDFYIQIRFKKSTNYFQSGQPDGKLCMVLITGDGPVVGTGQPRTPNQELVLKAHPSGVGFMYTNFGNRSNSWITGTQGGVPSGSYQPGGVAAGTCFSQSDIPNCTHYDGTGWWTALLYMSPGTCGGNGNDPIMSGNTNNNTIVKAWFAAPGATSYTKWYDKSDLVWSYGSVNASGLPANAGDDPWPLGFNCLALNAFLNNQPPISGQGDIVHRYAQVIFSRSTIACPQV